VTPAAHRAGRRCGLLRRRLAGLAGGDDFGDGQGTVGVDAVDQRGGEVGKRLAAYRGCDVVLVGVSQLSVEPGEPGPEAGGQVRGGDAVGGLLQQGLQRQLGLPVLGRGLVQLGLGDPDRVHDDDVGLGCRVWGDLLEVGVVDDPDAATLHLLEEVA